MKISFISNYHGQGAITSNILAISNVFAKEYNQKVILTQTHFDKNNLQRSLLGESFDRNEIVNFDNTGIDALIRYSKSGPITEQIVNNCSVTLTRDHFSYIAGTNKKNKEVYLKDMIERYPNILNSLNCMCDYVFIDTNSGDNELTQMVLKEADIVIANLSQNIAVIKDYFVDDKYANYLDKTLFLIGNYNCNSKFSIRNLRSCIKEFDKNNLAAIPYNVEFLDSQCEGKVLEFFEQNLSCTKLDNNYYFINSVKNAARLIKKAEQYTNREAV